MQILFGLSTCTTRQTAWNAYLWNEARNSKRGPSSVHLFSSISVASLLKWGHSRRWIHHWQSPKCNGHRRCNQRTESPSHESLWWLWSVLRKGYITACISWYPLPLWFSFRYDQINLWPYWKLNAPSTRLVLSLDSMRTKKTFPILYLYLVNL